jgi:hypothetical protein
MTKTSHEERLSFTDYQYHRYTAAALASDATEIAALCGHRSAVSHHSQVAGYPRPGRERGMCLLAISGHRYRGCHHPIK